MDSWKLNLLGGLSLEKGDVVIDQSPTRRAAMMLARLALSRNGSVGRDELAEEFWPEDYLDTTRLRLRQELKRLRGVLGDGKDLIDADRTWIRIDLEQVSIDVREFERCFAISQTSEGDRKLELLERACDLYHGPLLPEFSEHWVFASRMDLREKFETALSQCVAIHSAANEHSRVIDLAMRGLRANPASEPMVIALARAQAGSGDTATALKTIEDFERLSGTSVEIAELKRGLRQHAPMETPAIGTFVEVEVELNELPSYFDAFVGRDDELDVVWQLLSSGARCVTLVGPGGVGKTRLSTEVARKFSNEKSRVQFLSLEEVPASHLNERIADFVRPGKPTLLVLDNAESDIESAAKAVSTLLRQSVHVQILTTSRQRLGISGERAIELSPIPTPVFADNLEQLLKNPAVALFIDRAQSHDPKFKVTVEESVDVIALMQRLEGLPLAIELAAAKAANVGLKDLAGKLDNLFTVLVTKRRDVPARQRSLWATIDWSYQNLEDEARRALEILSLCPGGCALELAQSLLGSNASELLDELKDRSLVVINRTEDGRSRYRLLEPIREFVLSTIEPKARNSYLKEYGERLADRLNVLGREFHGPNEAWAFAEKGREFDNIMMGMTWGLEHDIELALRLGTLSWRYWCHVGHRNEGHRAMVDVLNHPEVPRTNDYALCLFGAGYTAYLKGRIAESDQWFKLSLEVHNELGLHERANWVTLNQTCIADELGDFPEMFRLAEESLMGFRKTNELLGLALAHADMSIAAAQMGNFELADHHAQESFTYRVKLDSPVEIAPGYFDKGRIAYEKGDLAEAEKLLLEPILEFERSKQISLQYNCYLYLVETQIDAGNRDEANKYIELGSRVADRLGQVNDSAWLDRCRALVALGESQTDATKFARDAIMISIREEYERGLVEGCMLAVLVLQEINKKAAVDIFGSILANQKNGYWIRPSRLRWLAKLEPCEPSKPVDWATLAGKSLQYLL